MPVLKPLNRTTLAGQVAKRILSLIEEGHFKPYDRLPPERELCEKLRISRTPLREGIRMLSALGILQSRRGSGVYVLTSHPSMVLMRGLQNLKIEKKVAFDLLEARSRMEQIMGELALERAGKRDLNRLEKAVIQMEKCYKEGKSSTQPEIDFRIALTQATHNEIFVVMTRSIVPFLAVLSEHMEEGDGEEPSLFNIQNHREIFECIARKDKEGLRRALQIHYEHLGKLLNQFFSKKKEGE